ncbi:MAG: baseplate J/gp47 family protein [Halanaerobiaceae bacterium]
MKVRGYRVFYIDSESGIKDLIELVKGTTAVKMALVIKNSKLLLNSSVNMKLLKKYVKKYKKDVVFVCPEKTAVENIVNEGFSVFEDLNSLDSDLPMSSLTGGRNAAASTEDDNNDNYNSDKNIDNKNTEYDINETNSNNNGGSSIKKSKIAGIISFLLIILILTMAYFYFMYPTATIEIEPVIQKKNQEIEVTASTTKVSIDWENHTLPLHKTEVQITDEKEVQTTGVKSTGDTRAAGVVKFINERTKSVHIPAGTIVETANNISYKTIEDVNLPELEVEYLMDVPVGMKAGQVSVEVEAVNPGTVGNVGIGQIKKLASPIDKVHVINNEPVRGGSDKKISIVCENDVERIRSLLRENMKSKFINKMYQELSGNYRIIEDKISYSDIVINMDKNVGDVSQTLKASATMTASGFLIKNNELDRMATRVFREKMSDEVQLMSSGVNIETIKLEEKGKNLYNIIIGLNAPVIPAIDSNRLVKRLSGVNVQQAQNILQEEKNIDSFRINHKGVTLPQMGFAIKVVISEPEEMRVFNIND